MVSSLKAYGVWVGQELNQLCPKVYALKVLVASTTSAGDEMGMEHALIS